MYDQDGAENVLHVIGAYGRKATKEDFAFGKDFKIIAGPYFSVRDIAKIHEDGFTKISFHNSRGLILFSVDL